MKPISMVTLLLLGQALGPAEESLHLDQYTLAKGPVVIEGVSQNASGLTYSARRDSLFVVLDAPQRVVELNLDGSLKRKINLNKFDDTEGIAWLGENHFAVAEEARGNIVLVELEPKDGGVSWKKATKLPTGIQVNTTNGLEGIAYDPLAKHYFVAREKRSPAVFKIIPPKPESDTPPTAILMSLAGRGLRDISGLHYDAKHKRLLILSHESACVVEANRYGIETSRLLLRGGKAGLSRTIFKAEGVALDKHGTLYIVSEPNQLFVFKPKGK
ncbi:MAG: SdiA-regulated domain-containing protein [Verrucomicrobia bacterium]|nr:SdiA-regulated domain-containing protein [Verrucomicrobiota bacterium]